MMKTSWMILLLAAVILTGGCASDAEFELLPAVDEFRISRYLGDWYELARSPNPFEKGLTQVSATYSFANNGKIKIVNRGYDAEHRKSRVVTGSAEMKRQSTTGELKVCFFWPFSAGYRIIALSPDYRCAAVVDGKQQYFWILARTRSLPEAEMNELLDLGRSCGFDPEEMIYSWRGEKNGRD